MRRSMSVFSALLGVLAACGQRGGEPCYENDDCRGSLVCCPTRTASDGRGTCEGSCRPTQDMGADLTPMDMNGAEMSIDLGPPDMPPDMPPDVGLPDAGAPDQGTPDQGGPDL